MTLKDSSPVFFFFFFFGSGDNDETVPLDTLIVCIGAKVGWYVVFFFFFFLGGQTNCNE